MELTLVDLVLHCTWGLEIEACGVASVIAARALGLKMPSFDQVIMGWLFTVRRACDCVAMGMVGDIKGMEGWDDVVCGKGAGVGTYWGDGDWLDKGSGIDVLLDAD